MYLGNILAFLDIKKNFDKFLFRNKVYINRKIESEISFITFEVGSW